jgi:hypothetical protein
VLPDGRCHVSAITADTEPGADKRLQDWVRSFDLVLDPHGIAGSWEGFSRVRLNSGEISDSGAVIGAYAPARALSYIGTLAEMKPLMSPARDCLAFESTVQNKAIQQWLVDLFSRKALAKERGQDFDWYEQSLNHFQKALKLVFGEEVHLDVELTGPVLEPRLHFRGKSLNFSQLSDGIRTTVGWLADFMMRKDRAFVRDKTGAPVRDKRGDPVRAWGILLLDEVDIYLHPRWQRILLPALRKALPDVQIIASSHSPFVISSCSDARIHVLTLDDHGVAQSLPPQDAPFGESVTATLRDIFGVDSRFDAETEQDLRIWDGLKKAEAIGKLTADKRNLLDALTHKLSKRSAELKLIVGSPRSLTPDLLHNLGSRGTRKPPEAGKKVVVQRRRRAKLA